MYAYGNDYFTVKQLNIGDETDEVQLSMHHKRSDNSLQVNLLNSWVVWTIMDETMRVLTNNHVFLSIASSSNAACKVIYSVRMKRTMLQHIIHYHHFRNFP